MAYPGKATHEKIYALLLGEEFKIAARRADNESDFVSNYVRSKGFNIAFKGIGPAVSMGVGMRKMDWTLPGDDAHPQCTYYYL